MPKNTKKFGDFDIPSRYLTPEAKIVILPVPFEETASWQKGTAMGPEAILEASDQLEWMDLETGFEIYKNGIWTAPEIKEKSAKKVTEKVYEKTKEYLANDKFLVALGGEHSISLGTIKAHLEKYPNASILHLDAHSDRRDSYLGDKFSHASIMARANELTGNIVSVGIRSMSKEEKNLAEKNKIFSADYIRKSGDWTSEVIKNLKDNVYVTIDLDVFDPGIMPSVGTPEPGGLSWHQVTDLLEKISKEKNVIGFDVVELMPIGNIKHPDFLAAKLIYKFLTYIFSGKK